MKSDVKNYQQLNKQQDFNALFYKKFVGRENRRFPIWFHVLVSEGSVTLSIPAICI